MAAISACVSVALFAPAASIAEPRASSFMPSGSRVATPTAYLAFCNRSPTDCAASRTGAADVQIRVREQVMASMNLHQATDMAPNTTAVPMAYSARRLNWQNKHGASDTAHAYVSYAANSGVVTANPQLPAAASPGTSPEVSDSEFRYVDGIPVHERIAKPAPVATVAAPMTMTEPLPQPGFGYRSWAASYDSALPSTTVWSQGYSGTYPITAVQKTQAISPAPASNDRNIRYVTNWSKVQPSWAARPLIQPFELASPPNPYLSVAVNLYPAPVQTVDVNTPRDSTDSRGDGWYVDGVPEDKRPSRDTASAPADETRAQYVRVALSDGDWKDIDRMNFLVNGRIRSQSDLRQFGKKDYWFVPGVNGSAFGDCEDYALQKRRLLVERGLPAEALSLAIVRTARNQSHAVLILSTQTGDYVLDNLSNQIKPWNAVDYEWVSRSAPGDRLNWVSLAPANRA